MTAYLSANLRHTDKRLQQSGPAVVAWRHRVRARRGARLMNIHEVGGDMTSPPAAAARRVPAGGERGMGEGRERGIHPPIVALINACCLHNVTVFNVPNKQLKTRDFFFFS